MCKNERSLYERGEAVMSKARKRAKTAAAAKGKKPARKAAKKSVTVKDLPPTHAVKSAMARIINKRAVSTPLFPGLLASTSGGQMAKAKKKAAKKKAAQPRKVGKKSVAVKNLKAKKAKSAKTAMASVRRRMD
jgi:hypothetical protein